MSQSSRIFVLLLQTEYRRTCSDSSKKERNINQHLTLYIYVIRGMQKNNMLHNLIEIKNSKRSTLHVTTYYVQYIRLLGSLYI